MKFNDQPVVDPRTVLPYYENRGIISDMLQLCNGQELRYINGYGVGHFLSTEDIDEEIVDVNYGVKTIQVKILGKLCLEHPSNSGTKLFIYRTAEIKYILKDKAGLRDYNVIADKSVSISSASLSFFVMEDNGESLTLEEVLEDMLDTHDISLVYDGTEIVPFDVGLQGKSIFDALETLCSAYGLLWSYNKTQDEVRVFPAPDPLDDDDSFYDKINNIHLEKLDNSFSDISVYYPIYKYRQKTILEYKKRGENEDNPGHTVNVYCPYSPAFVSNNGSTRNSSDLDYIKSVIVDNLQKVGKAAYLIEKHHFEFPSSPISLSEIHGDWGYGPRSIFRYIDYPTIKVPDYSPNTRFAWNWIGYLVHNYSTDVGPVPYFVVTPTIGLDGAVPQGYQAVYNIYNWNYGETGWVVRVEWDCTNNRWIALQQQYECPPEEPEPEPPPPVEPPIDESGRIPGFGELSPE